MAAMSGVVGLARRLRVPWDRRPRCPFTLYVVVFLIVTAAGVLLLQWSVYTETRYVDDAQVDSTTRILGTIGGQLTRFVSQMWLEGRWQFLLNFLVLGLIYLTTVTLFNRFWIATALFGTAVAVFAVANRFKVQLRDEPIIPADLGFVSGGNTGELLSFIPEDGAELMRTALTGLAGFIIACLLLQLIDRRKGLIPCSWRPSRLRCFAGAATVSLRVLVFILCATLSFSYVWNLSIPGSWAQRWSQGLSDSPTLWSALDDARNNGTAVSFLRLVHSKTMDAPDGYGREAMEDIARRYARSADGINAGRSDDLSDNTVIMILSESFSDPTRVPGVDLAADPMPNIRGIKDSTTSGLLLSPGYGGGTANLEYQALTGLDMANFDPSMLSAYQQLLPNQDDPYSFNQIWNAAYGEDGSIAFHPYYRNMYFRDSNYEKFGFSHFYTLDSDPAIAPQDHVEASSYVSDAAAYQSVLNAVGDQSHPRFIQLVTMQNHTPYLDYYVHNEFYDLDRSDLPDSERHDIENYAKGVSVTDQATADFLSALDRIDKPVTVIFYGDHLPGIYATANADPDNSVALHETDYLIWSNSASASAGTKLSDEAVDFSSSNYLMSTAAEHMNATVSPYLALLTEMQHEIPAISRVGGPSSGWGEGEVTYLDQNGSLIDPDSLSSPARRLLDDYLLVQYDMTAGKGFLAGTGFFDAPETEKLERAAVPHR